MLAVEWKLNATTDKNKRLISKSDRNWRQLLNRNIESYQV